MGRMGQRVVAPAARAKPATALPARKKQSPHRAGSDRQNGVAAGRSVGGDVPGDATGDNDKNDECGDHAGLLIFHDIARSIGQMANRVTISRVLNGLWPVKPTTPPIKADAAMVSTKRAKPSFCSLLYLEVIAAFYGAAPNGRQPQKNRHPRVAVCMRSNRAGLGRHRIRKRGGCRLADLAACRWRSNQRSWPGYRRSGRK